MLSTKHFLLNQSLGLEGTVDDIACLVKCIPQLLHFLSIN